MILYPGYWRKSITKPSVDSSLLITNGSVPSCNAAGFNNPIFPSRISYGCSAVSIIGWYSISPVTFRTCSVPSLKTVSSIFLLLERRRKCPIWLINLSSVVTEIYSILSASTSLISLPSSSFITSPTRRGQLSFKTLETTISFSACKISTGTP